MNSLQSFIRIGRIEAISLLLLLFVAMPIKYMLGDPRVVSVVGAIHGVLFVLYAWVAYQVSLQSPHRGWRFLLLALFLGSVPFGTFLFERLYLNKESPAQ